MTGIMLFGFIKISWLTDIINNGPNFHRRDAEFTEFFPKNQEALHALRLCNAIH